MSLLEEFMTKCIYMVKTITPDGFGGYVTTYTEGTEFDAAVVLDNSMQARTAEKAGVTAIYTVTTPRSMNLQFHDVFKRKEDKKIFRVTSDGDDKKTPMSASIDMRQVSAEEWELPGYEESTGT